MELIAKQSLATADILQFWMTSHYFFSRHNHSFETKSTVHFYLKAILVPQKNSVLLGRHQKLKNYNFYKKWRDVLKQMGG